MRIKEGKKKRFLPFLIDVTLANSMTFRELSFFCCFCSRNNVGYVSFFYQTVRHWLTALHVCRGIFRLIEQYVYTHDCSRSSWKVCYRYRPRPESSVLSLSVDSVLALSLSVVCLVSWLSEELNPPPKKKKKKEKKKNTTYDCHGIQYETLSLPWKSWSIKLYMGHRKGKWTRKKTLLESRQQYMSKWCLGCLLSLYHSWAKRRAVVSAANDVTGCWRRDQALMVLLPFLYYLCQEFYALYIRY